MEKREKMAVTVSLALLAAILASVLLFWKMGKTEVTLEFGMFTGSNWDVASANSFLVIDEVIARFEEEHPGVKVHYYSGIRKDDYSEWLSRKLLTGKEPDVFMVLGEDFNQFSFLKVMKNLNELIQQDTDFDTDRYFTSALNTGKYDGNQYALPYETVPTLMFVNKTLLYKEGIELPGLNWTWDDLYEICKAVTKDTSGDGILDQFGIYNYNWMDAVYANGAELFHTDGSGCSFTDPRVVEAVRLLQKLNNLNNGHNVTQEDYNGGNVAFMPLTFAEYRTYKTYPYKIKKYDNFQWDCITMPAGPEGDNTSQVDTLLMGISAHTQKEQLAWEFLKFLTYDEANQAEVFRYSQGASVLKNVTTSEKMEEVLQENMEEGDTVISGELLGQVIENGHVEPQFQKYGQAITLADGEISQLLESNKALDTSMKIVQQDINDFLKR